MFRLIDTPGAIQDSGVSARGKGMLVFLVVLFSVGLWSMSNVMLGSRFQDGGWSMTRTRLVLILAAYCSFRAVRLFTIRAVLGEWLGISVLLLTAPIWIDSILSLVATIYTRVAG